MHGSFISFTKQELMSCVQLSIFLGSITFCSSTMYWDNLLSVYFLVNVSILFGIILIYSKYFPGFLPSRSTKKNNVKGADIGGFGAKSSCTRNINAVKHLEIDLQSFQILEVKLLGT